MNYIVVAAITECGVNLNGLECSESSSWSVVDRILLVEGFEC